MNILTGNNFEGGMDQEGGSHPQINLNAEEEKAVDRVNFTSLIFMFFLNIFFIYFIAHGIWF